MNQNSPWLPLAALLLAVLGAAGLLMAFQARISSSESSVAAHTPVVDGVLSEREYAQNYRDETTGITLAWTVVGEELFVGLMGPTAGWIALGLDPTGSLMVGADIWIGYVDKDGRSFVQDGFASQKGMHQADTALGGQASFLQVAGTENAHGTTIELRRKLDTGDPYDKPVGPGKHIVLLARGDADDFVTYHAQRTALQLDFLAASTGAAPTSGGIIPAHLEAYEVWQIAWVFALALFGVQGLISVFLEGQELRPGMKEALSESNVALLLMALLLLAELFICFKFINDLAGAASVQTLAWETSAGFFLLAAMVIVYRRWFLPHEVLVQERRDHVPW